MLDKMQNESQREYAVRLESSSIPLARVKINVSDYHPQTCSLQLRHLSLLPEAEALLHPLQLPYIIVDEKTLQALSEGPCEPALEACLKVPCGPIVEKLVLKAGGQSFPVYQAYGRMTLPEVRYAYLNERQACANTPDAALCQVFHWLYIGQRERALQCLAPLAEAPLRYDQLVDAANYAADLNAIDLGMRFYQRSSSVGSSPALFHAAARLHAVNRLAGAETGLIKQCLGAAEALSLQPSDHIACALAWDRHGYTERAYDNIRKLSPGPSELDWYTTAEAWGQIGAGDYALACMEEAVRVAAQPDGVVDRTDKNAILARSWLSIGCRDKALGCIEQAESNARSSEEWQHCAHEWLIFGALDNATRCLREAEGLEGDYTHQLFHKVSCAKHWIYLGNVERARAALSRAEADAVDSFGWRWCVQAWRSLGELKEINRCLWTSERCAEASRDFSAVATRWLDLGDADGARRCLVKARALAQCSDDWLRTGKLLFTLDRDEAASCLEKAEKKALFAREWADCAALWLDHGSIERATRCLANGERKATSEECWKAIARVWQQMGLVEKVVHCQERLRVFQDDINSQWSTMLW